MFPRCGVLSRNEMVASFVTPPFLGAFCWTMLAGPNAGVLNKWWMSLTGSSSGLFNVYSVAGLTFVTFLYCYPYVFTFYTFEGLYHDTVFALKDRGFFDPTKGVMAKVERAVGGVTG